MSERSTAGQLEELLRHDAQAALRGAIDLLNVRGSDRQSPAYQNLLLIKGAAQARVGQTEDGARLIRQVIAWTSANGQTALLARAHRRMSALFRRVGDPALMLEHAVTAVDLLDDSTSDAVRADHLLGLADALGAGGSYAESIRRYEEAAFLADRSGDRHLRSAVLNNLAYTQYEAGLAQEAVATAEQLRIESELDGRPLVAHDVDTMARAYTAVGRMEDAVAILAPICDSEPNGEDCDGLVMALTTLSEVHRLAGSIDAAQATLDRCRQLIERYGLSGRDTDAQREQAELYAARGEYREAFETFRAFHEADGKLRALERDRRARTLNAIFGATEARRSSDHFRELSVRDPLTGLHNRRHTDRRLSEMLAGVHQGGQLSVCLLDLDHFKQINDTRSHAVGDEVLRLVAGILVSAASAVEGGLAARVGGEEFLVLLPGVGRSECVERMEQLRREIAAHAWSGIAEGVTLTVSIGVAAAPGDGADVEGLLAVADRNMYLAKRHRDRVIA